MRRLSSLVTGGFAILGLVTLAPAQNSCPGDCSNDRQVTVDEVVTLVNIALGTLPIASCPAGDTSGDEQITVEELQAAINIALAGCPAVGPTPTPTAPATSGLRIDLSDAAGSAGATVTIEATLSGAFADTAATSNDIVYDATVVQVARDGNNRPNCTISPRIGPGTPADKMLTLSVLPGAGTLERVRIGLFGINSEPLTDGSLFSCDFVIAAAAPPQTVVLNNIPGAATLNGHDIVNSTCVGPETPLPCCTGASAGSCIVEGRNPQLTVNP